MGFRHVATLLAEGVSLDSITGRLSVFNMLETVLAPTFPAAIAKLAVVTLYEIDDGRGPYWERLTVVGVQGEDLAQVQIELTGQGDTHRSMAMFQGIRVATPGDYSIKVEGATGRDGPWLPVSLRRLRAQVGLHPLVKEDDKNPTAGKIAGPVALTE